MTFEEEDYKKLGKNDALWKYLDFHKLIDLISSKKLHFTRLDQFEDPFEGATRNLIFKRHIAKQIPTKPLLEKDFYEGFLDEQKKKKEQTLKDCEIEINSSQKTQFVNCWNRLERESMAMWDLYSNSNSIAIALNGRKFIDNLKTVVENQKDLLPNHLSYAGSVFYDKINPPDFFDKNEKPNRISAFKKDVCFSHEEEYRLLICSTNDMIDNNPKFHKIKLYDSFFDDIEIICHPKMEDWKFKNIECICEKFHIKLPQKSKIELNFNS